MGCSAVCQPCSDVSCLCDTGWALVGEQDKYVALSPQRIVAARTTVDATHPDASDAMHESELQSGGALHFHVIGATNETVAITVVVPSTGVPVGDGCDTDLEKAMAGKVLVARITFGLSGQAMVSCSNAACSVSLA